MPVSCFVGQKSGKLKVQFYVGSSVLKIPIANLQIDMHHFENIKTSHPMSKTKSPLNRAGFITLSILFVLGLFNSVKAQDTLRILFIGNSMTYVQDLPGLLTNLASSNGKTVITAQNTPGGYYLSDHVTDPVSLGLMAQGFDYIVVHEQSGGNIQPALPSPDITRPIEIIDSIAKAHCSKLLLYATPGYPETHPWSQEPYEDMQADIIYKYSLTAHSVRAACLPTAHAFREMIRDYPGISDMWASPTDYHPGIKGQYLHACVLYSVLYNESAVGSSAPSGISISDANILQQTAWNQVKDSAYIHGYYKLNQFQTGFSIHSDSLYVTVRDSSSSMINKKMIYWGDGNSSLIIPVLFQDFNTATHNYSQVGNYTITQKVWWSECDSGEVIQNISLPLSNNQLDDSSSLFTFYPNPTKNFIIIKTNQSSFELKQIQIFDTQGRLIMSNQKSMQNGQLTIDLSSTPNQLLFITLTEKNGRQQTVKILKD
jgi:hypothetical protein